MFCVEGGINTSYIDSLLIALFYKPSTIDNILNNSPISCEFYYLQELFRNFVEIVRRNYSVGLDLLNEIRNYSIMCGWKQDGNILDLFNVSDYYNFIVTSLNSNIIRFEIIDKDNNQISEKQISLINISISKDTDSDIKINELLDQWANIEIKNVYHFLDIPNYIPIYINRFDINKIFYRGKVNIMKAIRWTNNNDVNQRKIKWNIHSIICYSETNPHYYTLVYINSKWYIYDNLNIPALEELNIKQQCITEKIKQECILLFFKLDEFNY